MLFSYLSGNSSLLLPTSHGPLTTHNTCVNPILTNALPEHELVGRALPQDVDGNAPRLQFIARISCGRRPSLRKFISDKMSVLLVDMVYDMYVYMYEIIITRTSMMLY